MDAVVNNEDQHRDQEVTLCGVYEANRPMKGSGRGRGLVGALLRGPKAFICFEEGLEGFRRALVDKNKLDSQ